MKSSLRKTVTLCRERVKDQEMSSLGRQLDIYKCSHANEDLPYLQTMSLSLALILYIHNFCSFFVNLLNEDGDEIFHYNPRDVTKLVVRNTRTGGTWGPEETSLEMVYPFTATGPFTVRVR